MCLNFIKTEKRLIKKRIQENDFNLNIPRYVDTSEEEIPVDLKALTKEIEETNKAINETNATFLDMLGELTFADSETKESVEAFLKVFGEMQYGK